MPSLFINSITLAEISQLYRNVKIIIITTILPSLWCFNYVLFLISSKISAFKEWFKPEFWLCSNASRVQTHGLPLKAINFIAMNWWSFLFTLHNCWEFDIGKNPTCNLYNCTYSDWLPGNIPNNLFKHEIDPLALDVVFVAEQIIIIAV